MTLTPAYGRDYDSKAALIRDLNANKDFVLNHMAEWVYCNLEDLQKERVRLIKVRWKKLTMVAVIEIPEKGEIDDR